MKKYLTDCWNPWTKESSNVAFKSPTSAVGDGEEKLGKEFNTTPLGQNSSHDLVVNNEKWEVKKLDDGNSFRLGVSVSTKYNNLRFKIINCLSILNKIKDQLISESFKERIIKICEDINTSHGRGSHTIIEGLFQNEVSEANLNKLNELLENLKKIISFDPQIIEIYSCFDGKKKPYTSIDVVKKINLENISQKQKLEIFKGPESYDQNFICSQISEHLEIFKNKTLKEQLDEIVRGAFDSLRLVVVDKNKGYKPFSTLDKVSCYRITSGAPRCRVNES